MNAAARQGNTVGVIDLSPDQRAAFGDVMRWIRSGDRLLTMGGVAGSGKSTLVGIIGSMAELQPIAFVTFTGKASSVLRGKLGHLNPRSSPYTQETKPRNESYCTSFCGTLHSLVYRPTIEKGVITGWERREELDAPYKLIVVDEASMVNDDLLMDLSDYNTPIFAVGDHGQLPPVSGHGSLMGEPDIRLEKIHRQAEGNPIIALSKAIRETGKLDRRLQGEHIRFYRQSQLDSLLKGRYESATPIEKMVTIVHANARRVATNARVRSITKRVGAPQVGDQVVCLKNVRGMPIYNGMRGRIASLGGRNPKFPWQLLANVSFEDGATFSAAMCSVQFNREKTFAALPDVEDALFAVSKKRFRIFDWGQVGHLFDFGYAMTCHKCVDPRTIVETKRGLIAASDLGASGVIATPYGAAPYRNFVQNRKRRMLEIRVKDGYSIGVTSDHGLDAWDPISGRYVRREAGSLQCGDVLRMRMTAEFDYTGEIELPLPRAQDIRAVLHTIPTKMSPELAEFFGLMVGDGCLFRRGFRLAKRHKEVVDRFDDLVLRLFGKRVSIRRFYENNAYQSEVQSIHITSWLASIGGLNPNAKDVPKCVMASPIKVQQRFLRGLFEDGTVNLKNGRFDHIELASAFPELLRKIRLMLLRMGIVSGCTANDLRRLYVYGAYQESFAAYIGFISRFKSLRLALARQCRNTYWIPVTRTEVNDFRALTGVKYQYQNNGRLTRDKLIQFAAINRAACTAWLARAEFHHSPIQAISPYIGESVCVEVPRGNQFIQDGFCGWNCQGSQFEDVLVVIDQMRGTEDDKRKWLYTAITRSSERLSLVEGP